MAPTIAIKYRPKTAVRKIHWNNVSAAAYPNSVWATLSKNHSQLEDLVQKSGLLADIDDAFEIKGKAGAKSTTDIPTLIGTSANLLSEKRAQNVMVFLKTLRKTTPAELIDAVRTFDESKLTESVMKQCVVSLPTPDEEKLLYDLEVDSNLREAEKFMLMVFFMAYSR